MQLFTEEMHHMTTLNLSGVLRTDHYDDVIRAISANMPNLKSLDISESKVQASAIEVLMPKKPSRGCPELVYLNLMNSGLVTVDLLKKIILRLPKLQCLKHALLRKALTELTEKEMDMDTGRCLRYLYSGSPCCCCLNEISYDALSRAPVFTRLSNITEVDIVVLEESEHFLKDILMQLKKINRLTLHNISNSQEFLLPVLESNGECLEYLHLHEISGGLNLKDVMRTCPRLVELSVKSIFDNNSHIPEIQTSINGGHLLTCLKKLDLQFMEEQLCSEATLLLLLKSPCLEEFVLFEVHAMSNDVMFNYLSYLSEGYVRSSKVNIIRLICCQNITEEPFVHWLAREDCMLKFIHLECCFMINCECIAAVAKKYSKTLSLLRA